jgi:hypothetical protein
LRPGSRVAGWPRRRAVSSTWYASAASKGEPGEMHTAKDIGFVEVTQPV